MILPDDPDAVLLDRAERFGDEFSTQRFDDELDNRHMALLVFCAMVIGALGAVVVITLFRVFIPMFFPVLPGGGPAYRPQPPAVRLTTPPASPTVRIPPVLQTAWTVRVTP